MTQLILQNGLNGYAGCLDTRLYSVNPTTNYSSDTVLTTRNASGGYYTSILSFDLSGVAAGGVCSAASFVLVSSTSGSARNVSIYKCTRAFVVAEATWNAWKTGSNWTTGGGDYDASALQTISVSSSGTYTWGTSAGFVAAVNAALAGDKILRLVVAQAPEFGIDYRSSDHGTTGQRPKLTIDYAVPSCGWLGAILGA